MRRTGVIKNEGWILNKHSIGARACLKSLKRYCKEIWAEYVKVRDNYTCQICGRKEYLNSHHIITAKCIYTKFDPEVGITLCSKCHKLGTVSAHSTPWIIYEWLAKNKPEQYEWFLKNKDKVYLKPLELNSDDYKRILDQLLVRFENDYPAILKRSKYYKFTEKEEDVIINRYISENHSIISIADEFKCGVGTIRGMFRRRGVKIKRNPSKHFGLQANQKSEQIDGGVDR